MTARRLMALIVPIHLALAALTWRDLFSRPSDSVRGPKALWLAWSGLNTVGSLAYWLFGRR